MRPSFALVVCWLLLACGTPSATRSLRGAVASSVALPESPGEPLLRVDSGILRGRASGASGAAFRGVPYAAPPVGERRWAAPEREGAWAGVRDATGFGYACMQSPSSHQPTGTPLGSEDCLTLNVFTPDLHAARLPVLVFIHGGFFAWGSSSTRVEGTDVYDGASLASRLGAVVVTLNYRLGPLGFLFGNFGLEDQIAALEWVHRNVGAFGGDPGRVTLSGHSAGAISTVALVAAPAAKGLFQRAIVLSGSGYAKPRALAAGLELDLERRVGCLGKPDPLECMRSRSAPEILAALPEAFAEGNGYAPFVDGTLLSATPTQLFRGGRVAPVPMIVGTTSNEFSTMMHTVLQRPLETDADLEEAIARKRIPVGAGEVLAHYPLSAYPSRAQLLTDVWSDANVVCPTRALARAVASLEPGKVWRFVYTHAYEAPALHALGAGHGLELPLLFRNLWPELELSPSETQLGDKFTAAIGRFTRDGDPSSQDLHWSPYDASWDSFLDLDTSPSERRGIRSAECDFWEAAWKGARPGAQSPRAPSSSAL
jgi:para-nitrobenzyl esterase